MLSHLIPSILLGWVTGDCFLPFFLKRNATATIAPTVDMINGILYVCISVVLFGVEFVKGVGAEVGVVVDVCIEVVVVVGVGVEVGRSIVCNVTGCNGTEFTLAIFVMEIIEFQSLLNWIV